MIYPYKDISCRIRSHAFKKCLMAWRGVLTISCQVTEGLKQDEETCIYRVSEITFSHMQQNPDYSRLFKQGFIFSDLTKKCGYRMSKACALSPRHHQCPKLLPSLHFPTLACGFCPYACHLEVKRWLLHIQPPMLALGQEKKKRARGIGCCLYEASQLLPETSSKLSLTSHSSRTMSHDCS